MAAARRCSFLLAAAMAALAGCDGGTAVVDPSAASQAAERRPGAAIRAPGPAGGAPAGAEVPPWVSASAGPPANPADPAADGGAEFLSPTPDVPVYRLSLRDLGPGPHDPAVVPDDIKFPAELSYRQVGGPPVAEGRSGGTLLATAGSGEIWFGPGWVADGAVTGPSGKFLVGLSRAEAATRSDGPMRLFLTRESMVPRRPFLTSNVVRRGTAPGDDPRARDVTAAELARGEQRALPADFPPAPFEPVEADDAALWRGVPVSVHTGRAWAAGVVGSVTHSKSRGPWRASVEVLLESTDHAGRDRVTVPPPGAVGGLADRLAVDPAARLAAPDRPAWFDPENPRGPYAAKNAAILAAAEAEAAAASREIAARRAEAREKAAREAEARAAAAEAARAAKAVGAGGVVRELEDYPIALAVPPGAQIVTNDLPLRPGAELAACWSGKWRFLRVLEADDRGPVKVRWKAYGPERDGWLPRDQLIVRDETAARLRGAAGDPAGAGGD